MVSLFPSFQINFISHRYLKMFTWFQITQTHRVFVLLTCFHFAQWHLSCMFKILESYKMTASDIEYKARNSSKTFWRVTISLISSHPKWKLVSPVKKVPQRFTKAQNYLHEYYIITLQNMFKALFYQMNWNKCTVYEYIPFWSILILKSFTHYVAWLLLFYIDHALIGLLSPKIIELVEMSISYGQT